jgi:hypothetical protein
LRVHGREDFPYEGEIVDGRRVASSTVRRGTGAQGEADEQDNE